MQILNIFGFAENGPADPVDDQHFFAGIRFINQYHPFSLGEKGFQIVFLKLSFQLLGFLQEKPVVYYGQSISVAPDPVLETQSQKVSQTRAKKLEEIAAE